MLEVSRICPAPGHGDDEVLAVAAALEHTSEHPIAAAIVSAAAGRGVPIAAATNIETLRGFGIRGEIDGRRALVGNAEAMRREGIAVDDAAKNLLLQNPAASAVLVSREMALVGVILLADRPRDDAKEAVAGLRMLGVQSIGMVTGDRAEAAEHIASQLGIDVVYADLRPEEKIARVQALALERPMLAMVGDGVNDAPALAAARIGIALGSGASDTALETADIVVLSPKLMRLVELIRLGRRTHHVLMQNVTLALAIKAATLLAAAAGAATMWMAVAADVGASLLVIGNGMRLMRGRSHDAALAVQEGRRRSTQV
jgi:Cd2+/Zn2+-exporting ATPase